MNEVKVELDIDVVIQLYDRKVAELNHALILKEAEILALRNEIKKINQQVKGVQ